MDLPAAGRLAKPAAADAHARAAAAESRATVPAGRCSGQPHTGWLMFPVQRSLNVSYACLLQSRGSQPRSVLAGECTAAPLCNQRAGSAPLLPAHPNCLWCLQMGWRLRCAGFRNWAALVSYRPHSLSLLQCDGPARLPAQINTGRTTRHRPQRFLTLPIRCPRGESEIAPTQPATGDDRFSSFRGKYLHRVAARCHPVRGI